MGLAPLLQGIMPFIPGSSSFLKRRAASAQSARYCYTVWLRHLVMARRHGMLTAPRTVAEVGPGASIGIGLAALLSGSERYYALDVVEKANLQRNLQVFDDLIALFRRREDIPEDREFPEVKPKLPSYGFPHHVLSAEVLDVALSEVRLNSIRDAIRNNGTGPSFICYSAPWHDPRVVAKESVDMVYSQAVMEHVDDLPFTYQALYDWLKPNGWMSHQVDFRCHKTAVKWNGHWTYSDPAWKLIRGKLPYLLNRQPHSTHLALLKSLGFTIVCDLKVKTPSELKREQLAAPFSNLTDDDLTTSGVFIQAIKTMER